MGGKRWIQPCERKLSSHQSGETDIFIRKNIIKITLWISENQFGYFNYFLQMLQYFPLPPRYHLVLQNG